MFWTLELASYLEDAPWPATKDELIDYSIRSGAPIEVVENSKAAPVRLHLEQGASAKAAPISRGAIEGAVCSDPVVFEAVGNDQDPFGSVSGSATVAVAGDWVLVGALIGGASGGSGDIALPSAPMERAIVRFRAHRPGTFPARRLSAERRPAAVPSRPGRPRRPGTSRG